MFHVVLYQPEIPPNSGNIIRLCANIGAQLHLIHPLGFEWDDARVRRAGLDYHELVGVQHWADWSAFTQTLPAARRYAISTRGEVPYAQGPYQAGDVFVFGPETRGLPAQILAEIGPKQVLRIPMRPDNRSLNLSNAVAVVMYEAWRQMGFAGGV